MKWIGIIGLLFLSLLGNSQVVINYNHDKNGNSYAIKGEYKLILSNGESLYSFIDEEYETNNPYNKYKPSGQEPFVYKNFKNKYMLLNNSIAGTFFTIEEKTSLQQWKLHKDTKYIKDLMCKKATTTFRGREYTAWYTNEISVVGGPWKFDGLPGLILKVSSDDNRLVIEASKIEYQAEDIIIPDYEKDEVITWQEYTAAHRDFIKRKQKKLAAQNDGFEYSFKVNTIEDIYEE